MWRIRLFRRSISCTRSSELILCDDRDHANYNQYCVDFVYDWESVDVLRIVVCAIWKSYNTNRLSDCSSCRLRRRSSLVALPVRPSILEIPFPTARRLDHYRDNPVAGPIVAICHWHHLEINSMHRYRYSVMDSNYSFIRRLSPYYAGFERSLGWKEAFRWWKSVPLGFPNCKPLLWRAIFCVLRHLCRVLSARHYQKSLSFEHWNRTNILHCCIWWNKKRWPRCYIDPTNCIWCEVIDRRPVCTRILALTSCNVPASSEKDSISLSTVLAVLTEEGCVMGIRTDTLDDTVTEYEPEETSITEEKVAGTIASDDDKKTQALKTKRLLFWKKGWRNHQ